MMQMPYPFSLEEILKKDPNLKLPDIEILREWCEQQKHLPKIPDQFLAWFVHSNYYSLELAKTTAENFYTTRTHVSEFFSNRDALGNKDLRRAFNVGCTVPLPGKTKEGYRIVFVKFIDPDPSHFVFNDMIKHFFMVTELYLLQCGLSDGVVFIADAKDYSLGHLGRTTPMGLKKFMYYVQESAPIRLKAIHVINAPPAAELLLNTMKPFMKMQFLESIKFHPNINALVEHVPVECLPTEYGGKAGPTLDLNKKSIKELEDKRNYFLQDEAVMRVDESQRVGKSKASHLFGVEGTFKKLEID